MSKIEKTDEKKPWNSPHGSRYTCWSCGTKFYDLGRTPVICPECASDQADEPALLEKRPARSRSRTEEPPVDNDVLVDDSNDAEADTDDLDEIDLGDDDVEDDDDDDSD